MIRIALSMVVLSFTFSCKSYDVRLTEKTNAEMESHEKIEGSSFRIIDQPGSSVPLWVKGVLPGGPGEYGASCIKEAGRPDRARRIAYARALSEIAQQKKSSVDSTVELSAKRHRNNGGTQFSMKHKENIMTRSSGVLEGYGIQESLLVIINGVRHVCILAGPNKQVHVAPEKE